MERAGEITSTPLAESYIRAVVPRFTKLHFLRVYNNRVPRIKVFVVTFVVDESEKAINDITFQLAKYLKLPLSKDMGWILKRDEDQIFNGATEALGYPIQRGTV